MLDYSDITKNELIIPNFSYRHHAMVQPIVTGRKPAYLYLNLGVSA